MLTDSYDIWPRVLRKYATQKLLICPPHLHNAVALPGKKYFFLVFSVSNVCFLR